MVDDIKTPADEVREVVLSGELLSENISNLEVINKIGVDLFTKNREYISKEIPDNWFIVIEPTSGKLLASISQIALYKYTQEKYPNKLFFIVGLKRSFLLSHA